MLKGERQQYIIKKVNKNGKAITRELTKELGVAEDTIRKDLQELSAKGLVKRIHGGVLKLESTIKDFDERLEEESPVKSELGEASVNLIDKYNVIYIDGGTTNLRFAEALPKDLNKVFITNSPVIALTLNSLKNSEVYLIGGKLDPTSKIIRGSHAVLEIQSLNIECCILGVSNISINNGVTYPSYSESIMKKSLVKNSHKIIALISKEKFETIATFHAVNLDQIDTIVTNETNKEILDDYSKIGIEIISLNSNKN